MLQVNKIFIQNQRQKKIVFGLRYNLTKKNKFEYNFLLLRLTNSKSFHKCKEILAHFLFCIGFTKKKFISMKKFPHIRINVQKKITQMKKK